MVHGRQQEKIIIANKERALPGLIDQPKRCPDFTRSYEVRSHVPTKPTIAWNWHRLASFSDAHAVFVVPFIVACHARQLTSNLLQRKWLLPLRAPIDLPS